jgi:hypothetical protein
MVVAYKAGKYAIRRNRVGAGRCAEKLAIGAAARIGSGDMAGYLLLAGSGQGELTADQQAIAALQRSACPNAAECDARPADALDGRPSTLSATDNGSVLSSRSVTFGHSRREPLANIESGVICAGAHIDRAKSSRGAPRSRTIFQIVRLVERAPPTPSGFGT